MKILISPAKSLDYTTEIPTTTISKPIFLKEAKKINNELKSKTPMDLMDLMKISSTLADLNWNRNQHRHFVQSDNDQSDFRQAIYAFNGDVYVGLDAYSLKDSQLEDLQSRVRILSGLYGYLRPFDAIEPYRLEMGTKLPVDQASNLYEFWKPILANSLNKELKSSELVVNLASNEYFSSIDTKVLKGQLVIPEFKELRDGKLKTISFYAKKARGMMVRYILDKKVESVDDLKKFNVDGYGFCEAESKGNKLVFTR
ncbi:peroxide stress protein YaaA [Myroides pelagicus]|uniref:UPF0246 protein GJV77_04020 n=1 Tax=Myroides pelagicus TaxID=270914 RepID=A0A7K1GJU4_9FLAO|nr:peroxide stress protein YaaA [Myroides pelagicus]MEC4113806.1 peroxide stress protein YaaA [Myroides pelagicus]MTH29086.1 peroxide stress protein YaaA [Myroides pelagicus]